MGFDLHGLSPLGNNQESNIQKGPAGFFSNTDDEYRAESQAGIYFRNNVWYWRPLWEYVAVACDDILTLKDYKRGQYNDGHIINAEKAMALGERLRESLSKYDKIVKKLGDELKNLSKSYTFDKENVEEFANFCINSGGFSIN